MSDDHPVNQPIAHTQIPCDEHGNPVDYIVGKNEVTRIEACSKGGEFCTIPYIRVWAGEMCLVEFCQHRASFVRFALVPSALVITDNIPF